MSETFLDVGLLTLRARLGPDIDSVIEVGLGGMEVSGDSPLYTVIGASLAVCLIDTASGLVGLCHVMLPAQFGHHRDDAMLQADSVLEVLNNRVVKTSQTLGHIPQIRAKLFGGADIKKDQFSFSDGQQSTLFSRHWLRTRSIPIQAESTGDTRRREIVLMPKTGKVFCKLVSMTSDFLDLERNGLLTTSQPLNKVELF
jgi:chemotaxis protein CheD